VSRHERELDLAVAPLAERLAELADAWAGEWTPEKSGGRLALPVVFGLRRGELAGRVELTALGAERSRLVWTIDRSELAVDRASVAILVLALVPTLGSLLWPFFPALFALVPYAAVFGLLAWWLVVSRLRSQGPEEFLAALAKGESRESSVPVVR
jgi:hypothetical protein